MSARARKAVHLAQLLDLLQTLIEGADSRRRKDLQGTYNLATKNHIVVQNHTRGAWMSTIKMPTYDPDPGEESYYETLVCVRKMGKDFTRRWLSRREAVRGHSALRKALRSRDRRPYLTTYKYRKRR